MNAHPKIAEYRDIADAPKSKRTVLDKAWSGKIKADVELVHRTAGYEPAGAMARWTEETWAVNFMLDNAIHGQRYRTKAEADAHFNRLTGGAV